jgi:hypothetical protein
MSLHTLHDEQLAVEEWRFTELLRMRVPADIAAIAAADQTIDLHDIERLIRSGCAPEIAIQIRL